MQYNESYLQVAINCLKELRKFSQYATEILIFPKQRKGKNIADERKSTKTLISGKR